MTEDELRVAKNDAAAAAAWIEGDEISLLAVETKMALFSGESSTVPAQIAEPPAP